MGQAEQGREECMGRMEVVAWLPIICLAAGSLGTLMTTSGHVICYVTYSIQQALSITQINQITNTPSLPES